MELTRVGAISLVVLLGLLVLFQLALALGAPWGRAAFGGFTDRPGTSLRVASVVAVLVWTTVALAMLRRAGLSTWAPFPDSWLTVVAWVVTGVLGLSIVVNLVSQSALERTIWVPFGIVATGLAVVVALAPSVSPAAQ